MLNMLTNRQRVAKLAAYTAFTRSHPWIPRYHGAMSPTVPQLQREIAALATMSYGQKRLAMVAAALEMARQYKANRTHRNSKAYDYDDD